VIPHISASRPQLAGATGSCALTPAATARVLRTALRLFATDRAHAAGVARRDATVGEVMALVAGAFAAIRHAGAETSRERSAHIAQLIDGLRPRLAAP
jgi:hypothetical protein